MLRLFALKTTLVFFLAIALGASAGKVIGEGFPDWSCQDGNGTDVSASSSSGPVHVGWNSFGTAVTVKKVCSSSDCSGTDCKSPPGGFGPGTCISDVGKVSKVGCVVI